MTVMPGVEWRPSPNFNNGGVIRPPRGPVLHIAQGSYDGTIGWQANPTAQVSSYFVNAKDGRLAQCVDLNNKAWTQGTGNEAWVGIENEGEVPDSLTDQQIENVARVWAWMHTLWPSMKIQITDDPVNGEGIGWHGMGASIGWGHPECPGVNIINQRPQIVARTLELIGGGTPNVPGDEVQKELFKDGIHAGIDGNHPKCATLQNDGTIVLGNGAAILGRPSKPFGNVQVVPTELPPAWTYMGAEEVRNAVGAVIGLSYEAVDAAGQWHPYVYYFA